jgi:hypothetical protein
VVDFADSIKATIQQLQVPFANVYNADETNVNFSIGSRYTLNVTGARTISARTPSTSNRCTVMLGCSLSGSKLPPFVIYKGKRGRNSRITSEFTNLPYPPSSFYTVQEKAWMDEVAMLDWIEQVWRPTVIDKGPTILILDEFVVHMMASIRTAFAACGTHLEYIPAGYTSRLQVMDVGLNKPFKDSCREEFERFVTYSAVNEKPQRVTVAGWINTAWNNISDSTIKNTWRHIGIGALHQVD